MEALVAFIHMGERRAEYLAYTRLADEKAKFAPSARK